jgi:hemerythrin-like domain-containing protein
MHAMRPTPVQPRIDDPIEMLLACHGKVRHFSRLIHKLVAHVTVHGADAQARDAAHAIWRYFEIAAPLHHADEDQDLYPALQALGAGPVSEACQRLAGEHAPQQATWGQVATWLKEIEAGQTSPEPSCVLGFADDAIRHADEEERLIYPAAEQLDPVTLTRVAQAMSARRSVPANPAQDQAADKPA